jgi:restriction endonuclease S subunit
MMEHENVLIVSKETIAENSEYNLTGERYRVVERRGKQKWPMVRLGDVCELKSGFACGKSEKENGDVLHLRPMNISSDGRLVFTDSKYIDKAEFNESYSVAAGDVLFNNTNSKELVGKTCYVQKNLSNTCFSNHITRIRTDETASPQYISFILQRLFEKKHFFNLCHKWVGQAGINNKILSEIAIPLPSLEVQRDIVTEIEGYQKVINGARQVVDNWKPQIEVDQEWPVVKLGDAPVKIIDGDRGENYPKKEDFSPQGYCLFLNTGNVRNGFFDFDDTQFITKQKDSLLRKGKLLRGDIVLTTRGTLGNIAFYSDDIPYDNVRINSGMLLLRADAKKFSHLFLVQYFLSNIAITQIKKILSGSAQPQLPIRSLIEFEIPFPPLATQQEIVANIEAERKVIDGCRELIVKYEEKIKKVVDGVWGE